MLAAKTQWYGSSLVVAPRLLASTKPCSSCGHVKAEMPLGDRGFRCEACGLQIDRDRNAARNLASRPRREFPGEEGRLYSGRLWPGEAPGATGRGEAGISTRETGRANGQARNAMTRGTGSTLSHSVGPEGYGSSKPMVLVPNRRSVD